MSYKEGPFQDLRVPMTWSAAGVTVLALILAGALLILDRNPAAAADGQLAPARRQFERVVAPVSAVLAAPVRWFGQGVDYVGGYFFAVSENRKLKQRIVELERWRDAAIALKNANQRYEALLKLRTEPPIPSVAARVVADVRGPFANARLADAGSVQGIKPGNPVMSDRGVVGRVVGVSAKVSRVLLLSDIDSRTPVLVDRTNARAILTGDGGGVPRLDFLRGRDPVKAGDLILTSGDGGLYPRGLPVGVAAQDSRGIWRVRLFAEQDSLDFVRILVFDDFTQMADQAALAASQPPPLTAAERQAVQAAASGAPAPAPPAAPAPFRPVAAPPAAARPRSVTVTNDAQIPAAPPPASALPPIGAAPAPVAEPPQ